ncbi:MAG: ABC transporter ATP-binding protein [Xanthomonadaceae bacterium]|nr:ABC transporter ATP-binding protein [Xanthomonadaceae bacterium]
MNPAQSAATSQPLLSIRALRYTWSGDAMPVINGLELDVEAGQRVFLAGASGSGKSTLLALIGGLLAPDSGSIHFAGTDLGALSGSARDRFRADHLGVIFQQFNLMPWLSAVANVRLGCQFSRQRRHHAGDAERAAHELLSAMGLAEDRWNRRADELSVGQQQRVAAARALIGQPDLVLADEPTSALDVDHRDTFVDLLFEQARRAGSAILFVSHDRSLAPRFDMTRELGEINAGSMA